MNLYELVDYKLMNKMKFEGFVRTQVSPDHSLTIYNYTNKAQSNQMWNDATMLSRGLIVESDWPHKIVARPFPKFFNFDEARGRDFSPDEPVVVTDKLDGSLGIMYPGSSKHPHYRIATRGSFTSDQAQHANDILDMKYHGFKPSKSWTYLFEIVYPDNRIVVDYGETDDLILLGAVHIESGSILGPETFSDWPGPRAKVFPFRTLREAVIAPYRPGKEGYVVRSLMDNRMVKVKQTDYVQLHRIVTGLNEKEIWTRAQAIDLKHRYISSVDLATQLLDGIPDELHEWVLTTGLKMRDDVYVMVEQANELWQRAMSSIDFGNHTSERGRKKAFATWLFDHEGMQRGRAQEDRSWLKSAVFQLYDGHDIRPFLWKLVKPKEEK